MRLGDAKPQEGSKRRRRRVGRGIAAGQGASCGFGMRGQKSRSGRGTRPGFEGGQMPLYRRVPKLKHFTVINPKEYTLVNVSALAELPAGTTVDLQYLVDEGLITTGQSPLKILGDGELSVGLTVEAAAFSKSAQSKIEAAGGTCTLVKYGPDKWMRSR